MKFQSAFIATVLAIATSVAARPEGAGTAIIHPIKPTPAADSAPSETPNGTPNDNPDGAGSAVIHPAEPTPAADSAPSQTPSGKPNDEPNGVPDYTPSNKPNGIPNNKPNGTPNDSPNKGDKGQHDEPDLPGFIYDIDRNYTSDVGYERIDIAITRASFYHALAILNVDYDAKGTVYADDSAHVFVPYGPDWFLVHSWEPGYWPNGFLQVDMYTRLDPRDCSLDVRFELSGRGAVLRKMHETIGPDVVGDDELKGGLEALGVCEGREER